MKIEKNYKPAVVSGTNFKFSSKLLHRFFEKTAKEKEISTAVIFDGKQKYLISEIAQFIHLNVNKTRFESC